MSAEKYKNILAGKENIFKEKSNINESVQKFDNKEPNFFSINKFSKFKTAEQRAYNTKYVDPLTLNFKLLIDFENNKGLFADANNVNSALAYLLRIQEYERFDMLKHWISIFKKFVQEYDFLILECSGLEEIIGQKLHEFPEDTKIELKIRETSDMLIQSIITIYKDIWFDNIRKVEVIPKNLRKFNLNILVFSAGYYNMDFYDNDDKSIENRIFPTVRKLEDNKLFTNPQHNNFNHSLFTLTSCLFNEESGKSFIETLSNEPSGDFVKNNMIINYSRSYYSGRFNNIMGEFNFTDLLLLLSVQGRQLKSAETTNNFGSKLIGNTIMKTNEEKKKSKNSILVGLLKDMGTNLKNQTIDNGKARINNIIPSITGRNTVIGNILQNMTPSFAEQMIQNTINLGVDYIEQKLITDPIAKVNNMLFQNFSNNLIDIYKNNFQSKKSTNIQLIENSTTIDNSNKNKYISDKIETITGITFGESNIYNKNKF